jgi:hypothetical protein
VVEELKEGPSKRIANRAIRLNEPFRPMLAEQVSLLSVCPFVLLPHSSRHEPFPE